MPTINSERAPISQTRLRDNEFTRSGIVSCWKPRDEYPAWAEVYAHILICQVRRPPTPQHPQPPKTHKVKIALTERVLRRFCDCPYQKPRRATTRSYSYCMPVTFRNNSKGKRPATKNKVRIANGHTARSAFPHERLQASFNQAALREER